MRSVSSWYCFNKIFIFFKFTEVYKNLSNFTESVFVESSVSPESSACWIDKNGPTSPPALRICVVEVFALSERAKWSCHSTVALQFYPSLLDSTSSLVSGLWEVMRRHYQYNSPSGLFRFWKSLSAQQTHLSSLKRRVSSASCSGEFRYYDCVLNLRLSSLLSR